MSEDNSQINFQGYNIVTILKRLEAATSRLEDITIFKNEVGEESGAAGDKGISVPGASAIAGATTNAVASAGSSSKDLADTSKDVEAEVVPPSVVAFEAFLNSTVAPFVTISNSIDPIVGEGANLLQSALAAEAEFLKVAIKSKKPDFSDPEFAEALTPINEKIGKLNELKDSNRKSEYYNQLSTIADGAPVVGWILSPTPVSTVPEFKDMASFWGNKILKEYKEKDPKQAEWVKSFYAIFDELKVYVKEYHYKGVTWNEKGKSFKEAAAGSSAAAAPVPAPAAAAAAAAAAGGAPPPPPPPPPPPTNLYEEKPASGGINAVFADLNKGEGITSGLKKVDKSQMTHKNPSLREKPPITKKPTPPKKPASLSSSSSAVPTKKPAKKELIDGTKWIIENYTAADVENGRPIVIQVEMSQSIFIGNCSDVTIQIRGKANAISVTDTKKVGIVIDSLISGIDIIKSFKFGLQVTGVVYMISVDKSDEGSIYLSAESAEQAQIFTSSTTALNVNVPEGDDFVELAIPEQFKHTFKNGKLTAEVVEHAG
ncbi:adenylyl cyclase-associated protein [[Candida] railenensis]|uniref:Adenylyl cyclase-associated protein n=1 Tax=[Candida] railenensis TaxID=45579 RepID=A0A9P0QKP8_9ASCO|nr:adenylyl cyclase-associated protein [[Candida] railenensis]